VERAVREGHYAPIALGGPLVGFSVGDDPRAVVDAVEDLSAAS
jgi:hypothetical protein